jgi:purine/pyrimidine-nucleoside phosphorylase
MSQFNNVTVQRAANIYFEGRVTSRTILFSDGSKKTLGVMLPGEYTFSTGAAELMEIQSGEGEVLVGGSTVWQPVCGGQSFQVPANAQFTLKVTSVLDYCCSFIG